MKRSESIWYMGGVLESVNYVKRITDLDGEDYRARLRHVVEHELGMLMFHAKRLAEFADDFGAARVTIEVKDEASTSTP